MIICRIMTQQQKPIVAAPSFLSLQTQGPKKEQVMIPDDRGILRARHVRPDTLRHFKMVIDAEEKMDQMSYQAQQVLMPATSLGSAASGTSVTSASSAGSYFSPTGQRYLY